MSLDSIYVEDFGGTLPVLLLHAGIVTGEGWLPVAELLSDAGLRPIVPDLRGFGRSCDPAPGRTHVDDVVEVLDDLEVDQVVVVGWSMGGTVAMDFALEHPGRVSGLGLVCTVPRGAPRDPRVLAAWDREEQLWVENDVDGVVENDIATWVVGPQRALADLAPELVVTVRPMVDAATRRPVSEHEVADVEPRSAERYGELTCPVLVLTGELDMPDAAVFADALEEALPSVRRVEIASTAHVPPLERPDETAAAIMDWIMDLP